MAVLEVHEVSRWFGNVVAVNDVTMELRPGITGLLGPNGAGKSTLMAMMAGFETTSAGRITLDGKPVRGDPTIYRRLGMVSESDATYDELTGREFVLAMARLHGLPDPKESAQRALQVVDMVPPASRRVGTYSKGMKQRIRMAAALVHDPELLLLDEPFNGMDPGQRMRLMRTLQQQADRGTTILVSSHILEEVQQLAGTIEVLVDGRHLASGDFRSLRRLMTDRPHRYEIYSSDDRSLGSHLMAHDIASQITLVTRPRPHLAVEVTDFGSFAQLLPQTALAAGIAVHSVQPTDESLESVFSYLTERQASR